MKPSFSRPKQHQFAPRTPPKQKWQSNIDNEFVRSIVKMVVYKNIQCLEALGKGNNYQWLLCGVCSRCSILMAVQYAPWYSSPVIIRIFVNQARLNDAYGLKAVRLGIPTVLACAVLKLLQFLLSGQPNKYKGGDAGYAIWRHHVPWLWWFKKCVHKLETHFGY